MTSIDELNDVTSTNPNVKVFNTDYSKLLGTKIIKHDSYIETITAKATDYNSTVKSDSSTVFSGAGMKTKQAKIGDIEAAITDYTTWLQKLKDEPEGLSATSIAQTSEINYKTGANGIISKDGDQIYAYINGNKISQNYVVSTSTQEQKVELYTAFPTLFTNPGTVASPVTLTATQTAEYDKAISRIMTYKAMADKISAIPGLSAYMVKEINVSGGTNDVWETSDTFTPSTKLADMYYGALEVKSLIPGKEFTISEVGEISGTQVATGSANTSTYAVAGGGIGAVESSRNALAKLITGKQEDVYTTTDLGSLTTTSPKTFTFGINIYDKDLDKTVIVPNTGATIATESPIVISGATSVDDFITKFNTQAGNKTPKLTDYVEAVNINGNLVIRTLDKNYDVEFSSSLKLASDNNVAISNTSAAVATVTPVAATAATTYAITVNGVSITYAAAASATAATIATGLESAINAAKTAGTLPATITASVATGVLTVTSGAGNVTVLPSSVTPKDKNTDHSGRAGAGAEFIEIKNKVDQTASKGSLQLRLDTLGLSDTAFGEFSVDSTGLITMKQDGAEFAIGQVAIALFNNNQGLDPVGDNLLSKTNDSGEPIYNIDNNKTAKIEGKTLELSTADLSESLVNLMVFQRAFEANAKSITTSDELLNTLINLKR
jgi:flagellar hook protein FlgE